ncbi:hypothetical protein HanHA300_Chr08g0271421 [Helianthus annuus]|nr:hypothetical protein HanHA300_Chr08g0271421 [Helianthus annuus]
MSLTCFCSHTIRCISHRISYRVWSCSGGKMNRAKLGTMVNGNNCYSSKVVVNDPKLLHQKKAAIRLAGPSKFQGLWNHVCFWALPLVSF